MLPYDVFRLFAVSVGVDLLAKGKGGDAEAFLEGLAEIALAAEACLLGNFRHGEARVSQIDLGFFQTISQEIGGKATTEMLFEQAAKIAVVHVKGGRHRGGGDGRGVTLHNVVHHVLGKGVFRFPFRS